MELVPIKNYIGYFAGDDGNIYSNRRQECSVHPKNIYPLRSFPGAHNYKVVALRKDGATKFFLVHRLICSAFHGSQPKNMEVCHGIGGRIDNRPSNLCWGTKSKNLGVDRLRDGTDNRGERHGNHKLTREDIHKIRELSGILKQREISQIFGVHQVTISQIVLKKRWAWLE